MQANDLKPIAILGAGSWGTALALYLGRRGQAVQIWSIEESEILAMQQTRMNERYLPGHRLADSIHPCLRLEEAVEGVDEVLIAVPSVGFRETLERLRPFTHTDMSLTCATKGLDAKTGHLLSEVTAEQLGERFPFAVLSGPSFAREVAAGLPAAVVIASTDALLRAALFERFNSDIFHVDLSEDVVGVEAGGIVKNVIAIATGISDGLALGANARSALITRGLAEMIILGTTLGGHLQTFIGLAGLGDLILTCSDDQSRNRRLGLAIGRGRNIEEAEKEIGQAVEGKSNAALVNQLAKKHRLTLPICEAIWNVFNGKPMTIDLFKMLLQSPLV